MRLRRRRSFRGIAPLLPPGATRSNDEGETWGSLHSWDPGRFPDLAVEHDLIPADWLGSRLVPGSYTVRMSAPEGYEAYARIFFPFVRTGVDPYGECFETHSRWTDTARRNGKTVHALMERQTITHGDDDAGRCSASLSPEQLEVMLPVLSRHSLSAEGWFLLWDGFGDLSERAFGPRVPKVIHPMRNYYLLRGPLGAYRQFSHDPDFWWPDDRSWCLSTDTDFEWSYLAGSRACVEEILGTPLADAVETAPGNPAHSGMDTVNDPDGTIPRAP